MRFVLKVPESSLPAWGVLESHEQEKLGPFLVFFFNFSSQFLVDEFPKVPPVSPGSSKFLTLPPSHSLILFGKLPLESPPAHPTNKLTIIPAAASNRE